VNSLGPVHECAAAAASQSCSLLPKQQHMSQPSNATAQVFVVNALKKSRKWFTLAELEHEAKVKITADLLELLKKNEFLNYEPNEKKLSFKFDSTINSKEDVLKYIEEKPLVLDDKVLSSYVTLKDDIEVINCPVLAQLSSALVHSQQLTNNILFTKFSRI
jgi:hypothetical protein